MIKSAKLLFGIIFFVAIFGRQYQILAQATLGARALSMGQVTTALPNSEWSVFANPAMIDRESRSVSFFGVRYYGFADITDIAAAATCPARFGSIGFGVHRYGDDLFNESRLRITYKNAYEGFHYGAAVNYNHVSIGGGYGSAGALGLDIGLAAPLTDGLWIGAKATNINQPKYGDYNNSEEELARDLSIGLSYQLSGIALFSADVVKDVRFPISYRAGVEVNIVDRLKGRAGITTRPLTFAGGFGYETQVWGVNVAVQQHENPVLGLSPGFDLRLSW